MSNLEDLYPLTRVQHGIYYHSLLRPDQGLYVEQICLSLEGSLDFGILLNAWQAVVDRHPVLRTAIQVEGLDEPMQAVRRHIAIPCIEHDWETLPDDEKNQRWQATILEDGKTPFNLTKAPLLRLHFIKYSSTESRLIWSYHHILLDGWSAALTVGEVTELYDSISGNRSIDRASSPPYRDYIAWLQKVDIGAVQRYWQQRLAGLEYPSSFTRLLTESRSHSVIEHLSLDETIDEVGSRRLADFAKIHQLTITTLLQAVWAWVINEYSGDKDVLFGTVTSGRPSELVGSGSMIGLFINTLPSRIVVPSTGDLISWLREIQALGLRDREFESISLSEIHGMHSDRIEGDIFDSVLAIQNYPRSRKRPAADNSLKIRYLSASDRSHFALMLTVTPADVIRIRLTYRSDRLSREFASSLLSTFHRVANLVVSGSTRIEEIRKSLTQDRLELRELAAGPSIDVESAGSLPEMIHVACLSHPDHVAVCTEHETLSYWELNSRANKLAALLIEEGIRPEDRVGICVSDPIHTWVGVVGILKAGGCYMPLDVESPSGQLLEVLAVTRPFAVVTSHCLSDLFTGSDTRLTIIDGLSARPPANEIVGVPIHPSQLAYVIHTSGSTGTPKGVQVSHANLANFLVSMRSLLELGPTDVMLSITALTFDIAALEIFLPLITGGRTLRVDKQTVTDPALLSELIERHAVTTMQTTPSIWGAIAASGWLGNPDLRILSGGEPLSPSLASALRPLCGTLWNLYGPTETTVWSAATSIGEGFTRVTIGRPIHNTQLYVVDSDLQLRPCLGLGELVIGGQGLARGYLNRPDLTAERFVPDPFGTVPGARLYRTGDVASLLPDGTFEVRGRVDNQIKIRGVRIEPEEIEFHLSRHSAVQQCAVAAFEKDGHKHLVAYFTKTDQTETGSADLRSFLERHLPKYKIPSIFVHVGAIPLTSSNKIDRHRLPAPSPDGLATQRHYAGPRNAVDAILVGIWEDVLQRRPIGIHDNFFEMGGHSLNATLLSAKISAEFRIRLPLAELLNHPNIKDLADRVNSLRKGQSGLITRQEIQPDPKSRYLPFPMTDVQQAYYVGRSTQFRLGGRSTQIYFEAGMMAFDMERFSQACDRLIERHDMLRAVFSEDGTQKVLPHVPPLAIPVLDLRSASEANRQAQLTRQRERMANQILPADTWPLFDIRITRLAECDHRVHIVVDNLLADAGSLRLLARELGQLYQDPDFQLPALELTFRDYVMSSKEAESSAAYNDAWQYWQNRLESLPSAPDLPLLRSSSANAKLRFVRHSMQLSAERWERLKVLAANRGVTAAGILIAAFTEVLSAWSGNSSFTLNLTLFNRLPLHPQVNEIFGDFTSVNLLQCDFTTGESFDSRIKRLQRRLWEDIDNRLVSGVRILRELARRFKSHTPALMPVVFTSMLDVPQSKGGAVLFDFNLPQYSISQTPQVWLDNQVHEEAGVLVCSWDAIDGLFPPKMIDEMFLAYRGLLERMSDESLNWDQPVGELLPREQVTQRAVINSTASAISSDTLSTLFRRRARSQPEEIAVVAANGSLKYGELSCKSSELARRLVELGVQPGQLVGIAMARGWEQAVAVLGVVQAGAAYVPIDPRNPSERLLNLINHTELNVILTQSWLPAILPLPPGVQSLDVDAVTSGSVDEELDLSSAESLAYVIYTSGSTGSPKGVAVDHRGAVNTIIDMNDRFRVGRHDRLLGVSSLSFDLSVYDFFGAFAAGATLIIPAEELSRDPAHWASLLDSCQVTVWNSAPALMKLLVEYLDIHKGSQALTLRLVLLSGDWIPLQLPDEIHAINPQTAVVSLGGATEASIWSIVYPIKELSPEWVSIPYGRPLTNQMFFVLDDNLRSRPNWVSGNLYIGGIGLARGYWRDEVRTAESFITHPKTGQRLYRTGDLGRYLPSGDIEFLGRQDSQIKVNGFRVELGEIQTALLRHPNVQSAAVVAIGARAEEKRLAAYVVARDGMPIESGDLREHLKALLPEYLVPTKYQIVDAIPLNANGKLDQALLKTWASNSAHEGDESRTTTHEKVEFEISSQILGLVRQVLHSNDWDDTTNLFSIGANSIDLIRITNLLDKHLQFRPGIDDFYRDPTVRGLAALYQLSKIVKTPQDTGTVASINGGFAPTYALISDPEARKQFKRKEPGLRRFSKGSRSICLQRSLSDDGWLELYRQRKTHRAFGSDPISMHQLGSLLERCGQKVVQGEPHRLYPSAGGLYPVQVYVYVKPDGVHALRPGSYYYDPVEHRLISIQAGASLDRTVHEPFVNRPIFDNACFSIFLIADLDAVGPMYGKLAMQFSLLEAGYLSQSLMTASLGSGIGLCPIGDIGFAAIRDLFGLGESHVFLHCLLGGLAITGAHSDSADALTYRLDGIGDEIEEGVV